MPQSNNSQCAGKELTADNGQTKKKQDIDAVSTIFDQHMEVKATITNATQIGKKKKTNSAPRLIKITVASEWEKALLLQNSTKLHNKNKPEDIQKIYVCNSRLNSKRAAAK